MNEEALQYSFELFSKDGYEGSLEDYKELIGSNKEALDYSYSLFSGDGFDGDKSKFSELVGVTSAKTMAVVGEDVATTADTVLASEDGSLESLEINQPEQDETSKFLSGLNYLPPISDIRENTKAVEEKVGADKKPSIKDPFSFQPLTMASEERGPNINSQINLDKDKENQLNYLAKENPIVLPSIEGMSLTTEDVENKIQTKKDSIEYNNSFLRTRGLDEPTRNSYKDDNQSLNYDIINLQLVKAQKDINNESFDYGDFNEIKRNYSNLYGGAIPMNVELLNNAEQAYLNIEQYIAKDLNSEIKNLDMDALTKIDNNGSERADVDKITEAAEKLTLKKTGVPAYQSPVVYSMAYETIRNLAEQNGKLKAANKIVSNNPEAEELKNRIGKERYDAFISGSEYYKVESNAYSERESKLKNEFYEKQLELQSEFELFSKEKTSELQANVSNGLISAADANEELARYNAALFKNVRARESSLVSITNRKSDSLLNDFNKKIASEQEEFNKKYKIPDEDQELLSNIYSEAWTKASENERYRLKSNEERYNSAFPLAAVVLEGIPNIGKEINNALGRSISSFGIMSNNPLFVEIGDDMKSNFSVAEDNLQNFSDLTDFSKVTKSIGRGLGSALPSIVVGSTVTALSGGIGTIPAMGLVASAGWISETSDMAGSIYRDTYAETGSLLKAEQASSELISKQLGNWYLYTLDGIPFVGKSLKRIPTAAGRIVVAGGVESITETGQETVQTAQEEAISKSVRSGGPITASGWEERINSGMIKNTFLEVAPSSMLMGIGGRAATEYQDVRNRNKFAEGIINQYKLSAVDENGSFIAQKIAESVFQHGENFTTSWISTLLETGKITEREFSNLSRKVTEYNLLKQDYSFFNKLSPKDKDIYILLSHNVSALEQEAKDSKDGKVLNTESTDKARAELKEFVKDPMLWSGDYVNISLDGKSFLMTSAQFSDLMLASPEMFSEGNNVSVNIFNNPELSKEFNNLLDNKQEINETATETIEQPTADMQEGKRDSEEVQQEDSEVKAKQEPLTEEPASVETAPAEETIPQEELEVVRESQKSRREQGSLLDNAKKEEKVYLNGKEGNIKIDPTNENTIIFESGDEIIELGNKDEVGSEPIAGFGLTTIPPEGLDVQAETMDADVVSIDGKEYNVIGRRKDKKGKAVVKVKEVGTGLVRRIKGARAERVLKDLQLRKEKKDAPLPLTVEGKEVTASEATTPTKKERRAERVAEKRKAREEYDKKSLDELSQMEEESQRSVQEFEEMALEEAVQESKNKDLVQVGENIFQVTKNDDGSFAVSQMNESGKLIGTREEGKRSKAIGVFKSKKSNQERRALAKAEKLIDDFKKEELQRIDDDINERLSARQQKAEGSKPAFNERISAPESIVTKSLQVLRNSYAAGMTIMQSIDDALSFIEEQGFSANEFYFKEFVVEVLGSPKPKETTKAAPKTKAVPTKTITAKERVLSKFGKGRVQNKVRKQVESARKALSKIAKGVTIEVYDTQEEFEAATNGDSVSRGIYDPSTKTIKINLEKANLRTVAHEVFHALLLKDGITNARAQKVTSDMMAAVRKVASPELLKQLDAFADQYKNEGLQSEESIAELFGILAENYESSPQSVKDIINKWLNKLAKALNVPVENILGSDKDVLDFLNIVSAKVASGEVIEQTDIEILNGEVSGTINANTRQQKSILTDFNLKRFPTNKNIRLSEKISLIRFNSKESSLLESDRMTGSYISDAENNPVFKFFGGIYFPQITGKWWASRTLNKAKGIADNMNANRDADGYIYATPIIMKPNSHMSNQDMFETVWEFIKFDLRSKSNKVTKKLFIQYLNTALSLKSVNLNKSDLKIKNSDSIELIIEKLNAVLLGDNAMLSFDKRRAIIKGILGDPKITGERKFPTAGSISEVAKKFEEEKTKQATQLWDIVMVMRTKGVLSAKITPNSDEFYHKSYPAEISSDQEIEVFFLDGAYNINKTYPKLKKSSGGIFTWDEYSERHPSKAQALSQYGRTAKMSRASGTINAPQTRQQKFDGEDNYNKWKGSNKEYSSEEIQDIKTGEPVVVRAYHGTTNEFYEFDSSVKGNVEGHLGKVNYFTSHYQDASDNYQADGGDLTSRIEQEKERIDQYIEDDLGIPTLESKIKLLSESDKNLLSSELGLEITKEISELNVNELPEFLASKELKGEDEKVLDLYVKLNNPVVIGYGNNYIETIPESLYKDSIEDAAQEVAEEEGVTVEEAKEDYSYLIRDRAIDIEGVENPLIEALQEAINDNTYDYGESVNASEILDDFSYDDEVDLNQLEKAVREGVTSATNEDGDMSSSQIVADMFKNLGYDGIILNNVGQRFRGMNLSPSTSHIHVFDEFSNQIKLADGTNVTFNSETKDIRKQKAQGDFTIQDVIQEAEQEGLTRKETIEALQELGFTKDEIRKNFKKETVSIASETKGLSITERFKQGFEEFIDAVKNDKRKAREVSAQKLRDEIAKVKESFRAKIKQGKAARADVIKEIRVIIKESNLKGVSNRTVKKIMKSVDQANATNMQKKISDVMDAISRDIDRRAMNARIKTLKLAKSKLSRLADLKELEVPVLSVLKINPKQLSKKALRKYDEIIINLSGVETKYSVDNRKVIKELANAVVESFNKDNSKADEIAQKINQNLDLSKTRTENLKQMLKDGLISDSEFEIITRFKNLIGNSVKEELTIEELEEKAAEKRAAAVEDFEAAIEEVPKYLENLSQDDKAALKFAKSLKVEDLEMLSTSQINTLTRGVEMLQAGFVTTNLVQSKLFVEANRNEQAIPLSEIKERGVVDKSISSAKVSVINMFKGRGKSVTSIRNRLNSSPLKNIDQVLSAGANKFKSTMIYENVFRPVGEAFSSAEQMMLDINADLKKANSILDISANKRWVQKAKIMIYQVQREFESNPNNVEVNPAIEWIKATIKDPDNLLSDREIEALEKIMKQFSVDGEIDSKKMFDSFTDKEKKHLKIVDNVYKKIQPMVIADAKMQGKAFVLRKNYVHLPKVNNTDTSMSENLDELANSFKNPALKNKAATQRTGKVHAISFDPLFNANAISKKVVISYYMYPTIKTAKITLSGLKRKANTKFEKELTLALEDIFDGIVRSKYSHLSRNRAFYEKALAFLGKSGYLAQLAGPVKAAVELTSNITHAVFTDPVSFMSGIKELQSVPREVMDAAFKVVKTTQNVRIGGKPGLSSKDVDNNLINSAEDIFKQEEMTSEFLDKAKTLLGFAKVPASAIIKFNEGLISKPDTMVARSLFVGAFNKSFESMTGEKPNWTKIANDQSYRDKFAEAIDQASADGDTAVVDNAASNNPFDSIPRNVLDKDATVIKQAVQMINGYMTRFRTFEYFSAVKAVQGLMGKGDITRAQGAMLLTGTVVRLSMYKMGIDMTFALIFSMLGIDEEEDDLDLDKDITRNVLGAVVTLALGRSMGNLSQMPINAGTEWLNKEYGEGITREGEYNAYKDGVVFSKIPVELNPQDNLIEKIVVSSLGSYTPVVKTVIRGGKLATRSITSKKESTREKNLGELSERIPFEIAGNLGVVPGYKTLRKIYLKHLFNGVNNMKYKGPSLGKDETKTKKDAKKVYGSPYLNQAFE